MNFLKIFFVSACVLLILTACVGADKKVFQLEENGHDKVVTVHFNNDVITKEIFETSAPIENWGFSNIKEARKGFQEEKKSLKDKYKSLPRGTVKFDFTVDNDGTATQVMTINFKKNNLENLEEAGLINRNTEMNNDHVSLKKHEYMFQKKGFVER